MVIATSIPTVDEEMEREVLRALKEEFFVGGESVEKFEEEFADYVGTDYAVAVSSGTDALVIALRCLGIKEKVITTPMTFVATAESVVLAGAKPEFADIDANTWNINPGEIENHISNETKAIMPVHLYGLPANMKEIMDIAEDKNLHVVEDCAQAHGAEYKGKKVGSIGSIGCYSFYSTKNMTVAGNGGMITTNDKKVAELAKLLREHGGANNAKYIGYNARMNTINAAFGRVQLKRLDGWIKRRREIANMYRKKLDGVKEIKLPIINDEHVYHLFVIEAERRYGLREYLRSKEIFCGIHYPVPIHMLEPYKDYAEQSYPNAEYHAKAALSIPMYPSLKDEEVEMIVEEIKKFYGE